MTWQDAAVVLVVAGAVGFLLRRVLRVRRTRTEPVQSFVPLSTLKRPTRPTSEDEPGCH